ncbi:MAG: hypothetical protein IH840_16645 [Candidatus Heimdallarchaeota archaeon]|nr:hypothetical protein [Candidatus Heimdallarchaeota archaeon]
MTIEDIQNEKKSYFYVAGHTYGKLTENQLGLYPPFFSQLSELKDDIELEFGVLTGDMVSSGDETARWDALDRDINNLNIITHKVVGNHDVGSDNSLYVARYGSTFYSLTLNNSLFLILDSELQTGFISPDQITMVSNLLKDQNYNHIFVFMHRLLWVTNDQYSALANDLNDKIGYQFATSNFWTDLIPLFQSLATDVFVFAGDLGTGRSINIMTESTSAFYDRLNLDESQLYLIGSGMGGGKLENFLIVSWNENLVDIFMKPLNNQGFCSIRNFDNAGMDT